MHRQDQHQDNQDLSAMLVRHSPFVFGKPFRPSATISSIKIHVESNYNHIISPDSESDFG